jgi:uncharacterized protein YkwD
MQTTRRGIAGATVFALTCGAGLLAAPLAQAASSKAAVRSTAVTAVNVARVAHGCAPLTLKSKLSKAAQNHADDMANNEFFGHTSSDGTTWGVRIKQAGYRPGGENLAFGADAATVVVRSWLGSSKQRRTILDCDVTKIGVGYADLDGGYWVADLGK